MRGELIFWKVGDPHPADSGICHMGGGVANQFAIDAHLQHFSSVLKLPGVHAAVGWEADPDAAMRYQVLSLVSSEMVGCFGDFVQSTGGF